MGKMKIPKFSLEDLSQWGRMTRAEFEKATGKKWASATAKSVAKGVAKKATKTAAKKAASSPSIWSKIGSALLQAQNSDFLTKFDMAGRGAPLYGAAAGAAIPILMDRNRIDTPADTYDPNIKQPMMFGPDRTASIGPTRPRNISIGPDLPELASVSEPVVNAKGSDTLLPPRESVVKASTKPPAKPPTVKKSKLAAAGGRKRANPSILNFAKRLEPQVSPLEDLSELPGAMYNPESMSELEPIPHSSDMFASIQTPTKIPPIKADNTPFGNNMTMGSMGGNKGAYDKYMDIASNMPMRESSKPSVWRRLGAALVGGIQGYHGGAGAGYETASNIVNQPYEQKMGDWKMQLDELEPIMKQEVYQDIQREKLAESARRTNLINQSKTQENNIKLLAAQNKHEEVLRQLTILEARNEAAGRKLMDGGDGFMHWIDSNTLEETPTEIPSVAYQRAKAAMLQAQASASRASTAAAIAPSTIRKNEATSEWMRNRPAGPNPPNPLVNEGRAEKMAAIKMRMSQWGQNTLDPNQPDWVVILQDPDYDPEVKQKVLNEYTGYVNQYRNLGAGKVK